MNASAEAQQVIRQFADRIRERLCPEQIVLFGSFAHGTPYPGSDVDMLIVMEEPCEPPRPHSERRLFVRRTMRDAEKVLHKRFQISFSPLVYTRGEVRDRIARGDGFLREIVERGEVL